MLNRRQVLYAELTGRPAPRGWWTVRLVLDRGVSRVPAVSAYRRATGYGLKEAYSAVMALIAGVPEGDHLPAEFATWVAHTPGHDLYRSWAKGE